MAQGRMLKRKITKSKKLAALKTDKARLLWFYMLPFTDVEGRIEADNEDIRVDMLRKQRKGYTLDKIEECLQDLHRVGLIVLYEVSDKRYLEFTRFDEEQKNRNRNREAESQILPPSQGEVSEHSQITPNKVKLSKVKLSKVKYTSEFEFFWTKFKGRWSPDKDRYVKVGKFEAFQEWCKLTVEEQKKATAVADSVSGKYTPDACRWLKRKLFDDFSYG